MTRAGRRRQRSERGVDAPRPGRRRVPGSKSTPTGLQGTSDEVSASIATALRAAPEPADCPTAADPEAGCERIAAARPAPASSVAALRASLALGVYVLSNAGAHRTSTTTSCGRPTPSCTAAWRSLCRSATGPYRTATSRTSLPRARPARLGLMPVPAAAGGRAAALRGRLRAGHERRAGGGRARARSTWASAGGCSTRVTDAARCGRPGHALLRLRDGRLVRGDAGQHLVPGARGGLHVPVPGHHRRARRRATRPRRRLRRPTARAASGRAVAAWTPRPRRQLLAGLLFGTAAWHA